MYIDADITETGEVCTEGTNYSWYMAVDSAGAFLMELWL